jgi:endonuclease/exonuclease/phosphatase family metal-dependent hydrolase
MEAAIRRVLSPLSGAVVAACLVAAGVAWLLIANTGDSADSPRKPAASPKGDAELVVGQFNMAGGTDEFGTKGNVTPDALVPVVRDRKPAFVTLQETCRDWNARLRSQLPGYTVLFGPVDNLAIDPGSQARCFHPSDFGNTIIFRNDLGFEKKTAESHNLGSTLGDEYREMICVRSESRKLVACSAHLTPGEGKLWESRKKEAAEAQRILTSRYKHYTVILGGDINDHPLSGVLGGFYDRDYRHGADGRFKEAGSPCGDTMKPEQRTESLPRNRYTPCRSGEPTHSKGKIDYLFVSPSVKVKSSSVSYAERSDHKQLWARVVVDRPGGAGT